MLQYMKGIIKNESGQALTEYALILAFVVFVVIVAITAYGKQLALKYESVKDEIVKLGGSSQ